MFHIEDIVYYLNDSMSEISKARMTKIKLKEDWNEY